jgi:hypothetical protein
MTKHREEDASRAAYGLAVAATRFHLEHGRWPTDRAELEPTYVREWPRDPLDEAPMRMSSNGDELTVYSVGQDLDDDGGTIVRRDDGDVCVTVKRPVRGTSSSSTQAVQ